MDILQLPFNRHLGITACQSATDGDREVVSLIPRAQHQNHLGTVHAAVVFALAEAGAAKSLQDRFRDLADAAVLVLRGSKVKYRKPAPLDTLLTAEPAVEDRQAEEFRERLTTRGRALIDVPVVVRSDEAEVFRATFSFYVTMPV